MIAFDTYWPLALTALVPLLWWVRRRTATDLPPAHLRLATVGRTIMLLALILALMQPAWLRSGARLSVVYLLDVSESVAPPAVAAAIDWIEEIQGAGRPDHARFIPFGANARVLPDLAGLRATPVADRPLENGVDQSATNLETALRLAAGSFAPEHLKRLVLISDGNENAGAAREAMFHLRDQGVRVFSRALPARPGPDTWIESVLAPPRVNENELFPVEVHVYSQAETPGAVTLRHGDALLERREVGLRPGINRFAFDIRLDDAGPVTLEARVQAEIDPVVSNDVHRVSLLVSGQPRVLYIEGRPESAHYLSGVLEQEGLDVEVIPPGDVPDRVDALDAYEAVILSDVPADALTGEQMRAITTYVRDLGGGFILAGGEAVYGEDGYSATEIEEILPVRFDLEQEPPAVALIIVLDKSGSMGGQKIDLAKEASKAAVDVLEDDHLIGLVAFDYSHYWPIRLQPAANRETIKDHISTIIAGGETNIFPALREAYQELLQVEADIKHVILLSDGRSLPDDFQALVDEMAAAGQTVSTVAVGNGADRDLLEAIARWGNGRDYFIQDATRVPQIFTEETEMAKRGTLREERFQVIVAKEVEAFKGIDFTRSPDLLGFVAMIAKDTAEVLLESDADDKPQPILARWQYGLGRTAVFTSDVKDRWAADWLAWDGYAKLWPQFVREMMRRPEDRDVDLRLERKGDQARVSVAAFDPEGNFRNDLDSRLLVVDPAQNTTVVELQHTGPGAYEASVPLDQRGPYVFRLSGADAGVSRILPYSYPDEHRFYPPDLDLLQEISRLTGGAFDPAPGQIFDPGDETVVIRTALWPYLALLALLLYLGDLLLRRVRVFEG